MNLGKLLLRGYILGAVGGLTGTIIAALIHVLVFIFSNGIEIYLQNWDYPKYIIGAGIVISFIPSGLAGVFLAFLLWLDFRRERLTVKRALFTGGGLGLGGTLILFGLLLLSPLGAGYLRMDGWGQVAYLFGPSLIGVLIGRWAGITLAKLILNDKGDKDERGDF